MSQDERSPDFNLDLIQMVQRARLLHDQSARPSDYSAVYWIEAKRQAGDYPAPTAKAGEWRVTLPAAEVDVVWERVKALTAQGELGYKSKVSTQGPSNRDERLLCVRTYDAGDSADVRRIGDALRKLGLSGLTYVPDKGDTPDVTGN